ncbi:MAG TPA: hypothetical protein VMG12_44815, partial [Polyangiaceae bacterium]|nr:hypothetical protein [Polyangiaceae bacterium]
MVRELLAAALGDIAPSGVRERVLAAVDAVLIEQSTVGAFSADAAPVTTLSGVFEKRRPGAEAASCVDAPLDGAAVDSLSHDADILDGVSLDAIDDEPPARELPARERSGGEPSGGERSIDALPCDTRRGPA